jgi:Fe-S cluster biosynthesis and repair protein YggX
LTACPQLPRRLELGLKVLFDVGAKPWSAWEKRQSAVIGTKPMTEPLVAAVDVTHGSCLSLV